MPSAGENSVNAGNGKKYIEHCRFKSFASIKYEETTNQKSTVVLILSKCELSKVKFSHDILCLKKNVSVVTIE